MAYEFSARRFDEGDGGDVEQLLKSCFPKRTDWEFNNAGPWAELLEGALGRTSRKRFALIISEYDRQFVSDVANSKSKLRRKLSTKGEMDNDWYLAVRDHSEKRGVVFCEVTKVGVIITLIAVCPNHRYQRVGSYLLWALAEEMPRWGRGEMIQVAVPHSDDEACGMFFNKKHFYLSATQLPGKLVLYECLRGDLR